MSQKAEFNAEEWSAVVAGPAAAGLYVITAQRGGTLRESLELARAYAEARRERRAGSLLDQIVAEPPVLTPPEGGRSAEEVRTGALDRVRAAVTALRAHADEVEMSEYGAFVVDLAERVAAASREGFLGRGEPISAEERTAIEDVRRALGAGGVAPAA